MTPTKTLGKLLVQTDADTKSDFVLPLTISAMVQTMLEIIRIKKKYVMDEETKKQFPMIAKGIILLAEQTQ